MKKYATTFTALVALAAFSQEQPPDLNGRWVAEWQTPAGRPASAAVELQDGKGTWQNRSLGRSEDPCLKVSAPLSLTMRDGQPHLLIERSKAIGGCANTTLKVSGPPADGVFRASFDDGREVTLKKQ